jgi:hypothetical protein
MLIKLAIVFEEEPLLGSAFETESTVDWFFWGVLAGFLRGFDALTGVDVLLLLLLVVVVVVVVVDKFKFEGEDEDEDKEPDEQGSDDEAACC